MNTAWRRLHPIAVVTALIESVRSAIALILPVLAIAVPNRDSAVVMAVIVAVIGLIAAWMLVSPVVRWLTTGYRMDDHGITQRSGVFNRTRTTIAYDHIHTLSSSAPIYMRPFHVVILDITAAGGESGMTLRGVPAGVQLELEAARQLDSGDTVSAAAASVGIHGAVADTADTAVADSDAAEECRQPEEAPAAGARTGVNQSATGRPAIDGELVFRASVADIVLFAVTDLGLFAALIVVYGFLDQLRDLVPEDVFDTAQDSVIRFATSSAAMIAGAVVVVFAVLVGASIIGSLLRFYGFEVWRRGGDLVVVRGALTQRITTIAIDRIQTVAIRRSLLRRALHLCSVRLGLGAMAAAEGEDGDATGADVLPVIGDDRVYAVLQRMLPEWGLEPPEIHRTGRGLVRYYLVMPLAVSAAGMAVAVIWALVSRDAVNWLWTGPCGAGGLVGVVPLAEGGVGGIRGIGRQANRRHGGVRTHLVHGVHAPLPHPIGRAVQHAMAPESWRGMPETAVVRLQWHQCAAVHRVAFRRCGNGIGLGGGRVDPPIRDIRPVGGFRSAEHDR